MIVATLEQIVPNVAHANHELEVIQGSRMNLRLHIGSREARVHISARGTDVSAGMAVEEAYMSHTHLSPCVIASTHH